MASTIWTFAAPGDRETLASAGIAWLLDASGSHGLGSVVLRHFCQRAGIAVPENAKIEPEDVSRDKRFDIAVKCSDVRQMVIEVKCKTFGSAKQLQKYAGDGTKVVRCGFGEWNWPDLTDELKERFPLVTLGDIGKLVAKNLGEEGCKSPTTAAELAQHLILEHEFVNHFHDCFISGVQAAWPVRQIALRYSQRFLNQLYWKWVLDTAKARDAKMFNYCKLRSMGSGEGFEPFQQVIVKDHHRQLAKLEVTLPGGLGYWLYVELYNGKCVVARTPTELVGRMQLFLQEHAETGQLESIVDKFNSSAKAKEFEELGWRVRDSRPRRKSKHRYCYLVRRELEAQDFQFNRLVGLMESLLAPADLECANHGVP
jgi:hypothetical protein